MIKMIGLVMVMPMLYDRWFVWQSWFSSTGMVTFGGASLPKGTTVEVVFPFPFPEENRGF